MQTPDDITHLVQRWSAGDRDALDQLLPGVYAELRRLARIQLGRRQGHDTLQPTALVNDVLLKLIDRDAPQAMESRAHLYNTAARMMRQMLVDRARSAAADKHGGGWLRDDFTRALELPIPEQTRLPELDAALTELAALEPRMAQVVELRYFIGLSVAEVAAMLELEERTVYRDWAAARAWLKDRLHD
ncbi:ECF-type sigma factor [Pseudoxanthomonas sp.]|uniref:ECF-type sigma factor n=1 Tax=Pseudoxanthomonas sp. TaxID=1871049 RepID=UPI0028C47F8D|nr:ECF-type sigma factor [Pseudoxanthomonas sp.]